MSFSLLTDDAAITWDDGDVSGAPPSAVAEADRLIQFANPEVPVTPTGPWFERGSVEHAFLVLRERHPTAEVAGDPPVFGDLGDELQEAEFEERLHPRDRRGRFIDFLRHMPLNSMERMASYSVERHRYGHYVIRPDTNPHDYRLADDPEGAMEAIERIESAPSGGSLSAETLPEVYDGFEHNGMRADVTSRWGGGCSGMITETETGQQIGSFAREIDMARDGVHIYHDTLSIKPAYQGRGFGTAFFEHSVAKYKEHGVRTLRVTAASSVGGYQWARRGFDFNVERYKVMGAEIWVGMQPQRDGLADDEKYARAYAAFSIMERMERRAFPENKVLGNVPDEHFAAFEAKFPTRAQLVAYIQGDDRALDGTFTSPQEIAMYGRDVHRWVEQSDPRYAGREMWLGKRAMLGAGWRGEMTFD